MIVGIIGLGLIGGSIGLDLKEHSFASKIIGCDVNSEHEKVALNKGLIDEIVSAEQLYSQAELILIAVPVDIAKSVLKSTLDSISENQTVTDFGSSKSKIIEVAEAHPMGHRFVAGHPIAGTENSGPESALTGLFNSKLGILCPTEFTRDDALNLVVELYTVLGMKVEQMSSDEHDRHLAYVSHLSHISSFALGLTVLEIEKDEKKIADLSGSGFESTVRLAKSSASMWKPIFEANKDNILVALNEYIEQLNNFKNLFESNQFDEVHNQMIKANDVRRILDKKQEQTTRI